jgi:hypothetical protein
MDIKVWPLVKLGGEKCVRGFKVSQRIELGNSSSKDCKY